MTVGSNTSAADVREVLKMIAEDMADDARTFDGKPFDGRTVGVYFGNHGAAIARLAEIVATLLPEEASGEVPPGQRFPTAEELAPYRGLWVAVKAGRVVYWSDSAWAVAEFLRVSGRSAGSVFRVPGDAPESSPAAPEALVSAERMNEILDGLNGFVDREFEGGTELVNGNVIPVRTRVGTDANLEKAIAWARGELDVFDAYGPSPDDGEALVVLDDGTELAWVADEKQWSVVFDDDAEAVSA